MTDKIAEAKALAVQLELDEPNDRTPMVEEYGVTDRPAEVVERTPQLVGKEIRSLTYQAKCMTVYYGVEIGRRLVEAKRMVGHGAWGDWVKSETEFSQSTASRLMRIFEEYGPRQIGIFGVETNLSTLQNLSISNALRLLAVPENERETFAAAVDAEHISARELERAIKERDEARFQNDALKKEMEDQLEEQRRVYDVDMANAQGKLAEAEARVTTLAGELDALKKKPVDVAVEKVADPEAIKKAVKDATDAQKKKHTDEIEQLRRRAEEAEVQKKQMEAVAAEAMKKAETAADAEKYRAEVETLRKQLAMADPVTSEFKGLFDQVSRICSQLRIMAGEAPADVQPKLKAALYALGKQLTEA